MQRKIMSNTAKVAEQYTKLSHRYDDWFSVDWPKPAILQGEEIKKIFLEKGVKKKSRILDLTCGMGTQSIGLALQGYEVVALDISEGQIDKAKEEAAKIDSNLDITWVLGDASRPQEYVEGTFDAVISFGNSLPLLGSHDAIQECMSQSYSLLRGDGLVLISMRDHTELRQERPYLIGSGKMQNGDRKGVWIETGEWIASGDCYISHILFVMTEPQHEEYHYPFPPLVAITKQETIDLLQTRGFQEVSFHEKNEHPSFSCPTFIAKK